MNLKENKGIVSKIAILWLAILLTGSFMLTVGVGSEQVNLAMFPVVPKEGEPVVANVKLSNLSSRAVEAEYQFYADGKLVKQGIAALSPQSSKLYKYAYENPLTLGEQVTFSAKVHFPQSSYYETVSIPSYPVYTWTSFVSFASFSTSMMSFMSSMSYYEGTFGSGMGYLNVGLLYTMALIGLLILLELTQPLFKTRTTTVLGRLRLRFSTVIWILFIIFIGIVYTKIVMMITT
ncbi:hypothetical protein ACFLV3_01215 [Chloroflexota bacterium]